MSFQVDKFLLVSLYSSFHADEFSLDEFAFRRVCFQTSLLLDEFAFRRVCFQTSLLLDEFSFRRVFFQTSLRLDEFAFRRVFFQTSFHLDEFSFRRVFVQTSLLLDEFPFRRVFVQTSLLLDEFLFRRVFVLTSFFQTSFHLDGFPFRRVFFRRVDSAPVNVILNKLFQQTLALQRLHLQFNIQRQKVEKMRRLCSQNVRGNNLKQNGNIGNCRNILIQLRITSFSYYCILLYTVLCSCMYIVVNSC